MIVTANKNVVCAYWRYLKASWRLRMEIVRSAMIDARAMARAKRDEKARWHMELKEARKRNG